MVVGRVVGWILCFAALAFLVRDVVVLAVMGSFAPLITAEVWRDLSPASLDWLETTAPYLRTWLHWPAWISLGLLGLILVIVFRQWRRPTTN